MKDDTLDFLPGGRWESQGQDSAGFEPLGTAGEHGFGIADMFDDVPGGDDVVVIIGKIDGVDVVMQYIDTGFFAGVSGETFCRFDSGAIESDVLGGA